MADAKNRDWANLPPELIQKVFDHLTEITDRIRFPSICLPWQRSSSSKSKFIHKQLPWLLLPSPNNFINPIYEDGKITVFSISENKTYTISLPEFVNHIIVALPHGRLIAVSLSYIHGFTYYREKYINGVEYFISVVNPITRLSVQLPPVSLSISEVVQPAEQYFHVKLFGSSSNSVVGFFIASGHKTRDEYFFFCRPGQSSAWSKIRTIYNGYGDIILRNDYFFAINLTTSITRVYDVNTVPMVSEIPPVCNLEHEYATCNFVESPSGELLLVLQFWITNKKRFKLFWLDESKMGRRWVRVNDIGDCTLFIAFCHAICFASRDLRGCRRNCVYFVDRSKDCVVQLFDIGNGKVEREPFSSDVPWEQWVKAKWFMPSLD